MDDNTSRAADAISEALDDGYDVAEFTANALCVAAAEAGGIEELLRNRSGSWEADLVRRLMEGTVGPDGEDLERFRKEEPEPGLCDAELRLRQGAWRLDVRVVPALIRQGSFPTVEFPGQGTTVPTVTERTEALAELGYRPADPEQVGWRWIEAQETPDEPATFIAYTTVRPL